ncbi:tRNA threonylcarbamoyladenosine biosynthesis protein TsaE [Melghiribacillus thermohalophilus]|uniref:tRNA threonylcarbamoyladenosine biosynthesis protein TsaE n=1 Tax=Melghiribacillus thermohalophilus TaxID=1324956 RepID=A0A4R3MW39_9BACI|nr:tRNA (adenosine(37)-N6)-threonylcarbamoyltransferase complex ATPase subunit type 1 TsaE [Melghiribacillus thermohalophilus]TCT18953.1 tRNA threonylcarbamoyladenosine biosynthesis protein TsaE [Melghiribacillus thermohalophilus]
MNTYEFMTHSDEETKTLASRLARQLKPGDVITLEGDLGAGKTTFTKGLANGLNISRTVNSPTFTIVKEYDGDIPLYHMDVYRLEESEEDIGFDEYFHGDGVSVVEWPSFIHEFLPAERLDIQILYVSENERKIILKPANEHFDHVCKELLS